MNNLRDFCLKQNEIINNKKIRTYLEVLFGNIVQRYEQYIPREYESRISRINKVHDMER